MTETSVPQPDLQALFHQRHPLTNEDIKNIHPLAHLIGGVQAYRWQEEYETPQPFVMRTETAVKLPNGITVSLLELLKPETVLTTENGKDVAKKRYAREARITIHTGDPENLRALSENSYKIPELFGLSTYIDSAHVVLFIQQLSQRGDTTSALLSTFEKCINRCKEVFDPSKYKSKQEYWIKMLADCTNWTRELHRDNNEAKK